MIRLLGALCAAVLFAVTPALAETPKQIGWEDLVPAGPPLESPIGHLSYILQEEIAILYDIRRAFDRGQINEVDPRYEDGVELAYKLEHDDKLDVETLLLQFGEFHQEIQRRNAAVNGLLDGELVRIPGYALPLEFTETAIDELLLVPYVGACIHVPPPPPNQTVFVELNQSYLPESLYAPVWITGRIKVQQSSKSLFYVDGASAVDTGYTLEGIKVEPYEH